MFDSSIKSVQQTQYFCILCTVTVGKVRANTGELP